MILNNADGIYVGADEIGRIYLGTTIVYLSQTLASASLTSSFTLFAVDNNPRANLASATSMSVRGVKDKHVSASLSSSSTLTAIGTNGYTFEMLVESPHMPDIVNVAGGTLSMVEEQTNVWRVTSNDDITTFNFRWEGGPEYYNQATSVIVINGATITNLNSGIFGMFTGLYDMTYFEWQGPCNATGSARATWATALALETIILPDLSGITNFEYTFISNQSLTAFPTIDTSSGLLFTNMFDGCGSLVCLTNIDTTNETDTTDMFNGCPSLTAPDGTEQTAILAGTDWTNTNPCPFTDAPPIYNLTEVLIDG